ncbi:hypothetical protein D9611_006041 [Ephemerocybe angulata]|uniref:C3H1-type domain-containing protein n=1 Tax=Ephemerocybe angulata TaxID=980116 RepID=A0A8H5CG88_9AGAR|nr:hypothetical protein D9611_006041 [Tulosesus angulatus]
MLISTTPTNPSDSMCITEKLTESLDVEALMARTDELEKECQRLRLNLRPNRIVALIDGDGCIFEFERIAQGRTGGLEAARCLAAGIRQQFKVGPHRPLSVYVFLNKSGLKSTLNKLHINSEWDDLDKFMVGFNQASAGFIMVDVGWNKEAADAKIKALLEKEISCPQTEFLVFGGCHDAGYVPNLSTHIVEGFESKIYLLTGYNECASQIKDLNLPTFQIYDLFIPEKIEVTRSYTPSPSPAPSANDFEFDMDEASPAPDYLTPDYFIPVTRRRRADSSASYASSVNSCASTYSDCAKSAPNCGAVAIPPSTAMRAIDASRPVWKLYYLSSAGCNNPECYNSHKYTLTDVELYNLREYARKKVCSSANNLGDCPRGEDCIYGHKCPKLSSCHFQKLGKCRFKAKGMHTPDNM